MKIVYLVRHGESVLNTTDAERWENDKEAPLTEKGVAQTLLIAQRAARLDFEVLIASPWKRTRDTAQAVSKETGKPIEFSELFIERRLPSSFEGMLRSSPEFIEKYAAWQNICFRESAHFEDGDDFESLKDRATQALRFIEDRPEERMLIVTHGFFTRMILASVILGPDLRASDFKKFVGGTRTDNTGLSMLVHDRTRAYDPEPDMERWQVRVFNDHAHLG